MKKLMLYGVQKHSWGGTDSKWRNGGMSDNKASDKTCNLNDRVIVRNSPESIPQLVWLNTWLKIYNTYLTDKVIKI